MVLLNAMSFLPKIVHNVSSIFYWKLTWFLPYNSLWIHQNWCQSFDRLLNRNFVESLHFKRAGFDKFVPVDHLSGPRHIWYALLDFCSKLMLVKQVSGYMNDPSYPWIDLLPQYFIFIIAHVTRQDTAFNFAD